MAQTKETLKVESALQDKDRRYSAVSNATPLLEGQAVVTLVTLPPDGGWGWVVVAASFYVNFFNDAIINTAGLFIGRIDEELGVSKTSVSLMGSTLTGFTLFSGPFVSALCNRYGFRTPAVLGGVVSCLGFVISSTCNNVQVLWLTYGALAGIGFGMVYVPSVISIGFYFERWRSLATSIAACGAGFGTIVLAPVFSYLLDNYGWRNTILVQAGMMLSCSLIGLAYRPLKPVQVSVPGDEDDEGIGSTEDNNKNILSVNNHVPTTFVKQSNEDLKKNSSNYSIDTDTNLTVTSASDMNRFLKVGRNEAYATVHDILSSNNHRNIRNIFNVSSTSINKPSSVSRRLSSCDVAVIKDNMLVVKQNRNRLSISSAVSDDTQGDHGGSQTLDDFMAKHINSHNNRRRLSVMRLMDAGAITEVTHLRKLSMVPQPLPRKSISPSESSYKRLQSRRATITSGVRPLYKEDIFFQANLKRLPMYSSKNSRLEFTMAVTHLPTLNDVLEEETYQCMFCPEAVRRTLATMLDMTLLTSPSFFLFCLSGFLTNMGFYIPYMFLESRIKDGGLDQSLGKWLISTIGVSNTIGRALCGVVSSLPNMSAMLVNNVMLTVGGVATILSGLYMTAAYQFTYAVVFGFSVSAFSALRSILTVDLIGLEKLTNGFGIMLVYQGISAMIGAPIAGLVMEWTESYDVMFILTGSLILISAVMCYPLARFNRWESAQKLKKKAKAAITADIA